MATLIRPTPRPMPSAVHRPAMSDKVPVYLAVALGYMLLLPPQLNVMIGTTVLPPYRFLLIPAAIYMIAKGLRGAIKFGWIDVIIVAATAWVCFALFMTTEAVEAFTAAFAQTTDIAFAYFFGRFTIRSLKDLRTFLILMAPGLFFVAAIMVIESVTHQLIIQKFFSTITGRPIIYRADPRLGLFRSPGPFPHPILAGVFLSSFLPLFLLTGVRGWPKFLGTIAAVCSFFTVSSAALLGLVVGGALIMYDWLSERIANFSWRIFFVAAGVLVFLAETATGSGTYGLILRFASMNSFSSYNRVLIWEYGTKSVAKYPWFGIGYGYWERPEWMRSGSMDHFWLLMAVRFGIIPSVLIGLATALAVLGLARSSMVMASAADKRAIRGLAISLGVFAFGIVSVALWLAPHIWFFMLIGLSVSLAASQEQRQVAVMRAMQQQRRTQPSAPFPNS